VSGNPVAYLDHAATTPMRPGALAAMVEVLGSVHANPAGGHRPARAARQLVDEARERVAGLLGVRPDEVVFTSGGTESDNHAIVGSVGTRPGVAVCPVVEHHAVLDPVEHVGGRTVAVDGHGRVDLDALEAVLRREPVSVVSVMTVNNEVGTVTDLGAVSEVVRRLAPDAWLHTDAVQAASWVDLRTVTPLVDMVSLSAHKFGGPKGCGILVLRRGTTPRALLRGGGQERGHRSGTVDVASVVATSTALAETDGGRFGEVTRVADLRDRLVAGLLAVDGVRLTVPTSETVPGVVHVCVDGVENEAALFLLDAADVSASAASACASGAMEPSHVLAAMGIDRRTASGALRFSLGHTTTVAEIDHAIGAVHDVVGRLRRGSPR
jgi:cysteine desulfurase